VKHQALLSSNTDAKKQDDVARAKFIFGNKDESTTQSWNAVEALKVTQLLAYTHDNYDGTCSIFA
jgi:hypothetical protein